MTEQTEMKDMAHQDILKQLADNAAEVIAAIQDGEPKTLAALANQQKMLARTLRENAPGLAGTRASLQELRGLVATAMDTVRGEMARNRGNMQATGNKRRVLRAYGTVTVSNTLSG